MANISKSVKLGVFTLAIMNVTAVVSLRGLPAEAEYGLSSAFYYLFAAIVSLGFYHACGFIDSHRVERFFTDNYDHPIIEDGIQLVDMVYLKRERDMA